ncbi:MAG: alpha/beta fold hydrolase [Dermatophilaceae bacterium]
MRVPTLILCGRQDPQYPPACSQELARGIPESRVVWFDHSGHFPFREEPDAFWHAVELFLTDEPVQRERRHRLGWATGRAS